MTIVATRALAMTTLPAFNREVGLGESFRWIVRRRGRFIGGVRGMTFPAITFSSVDTPLNFGIEVRALAGVSVPTRLGTTGGTKAGI